jgi:DNA-binding NtrC family response regulator
MSDTWLSFAKAGFAMAVLVVEDDGLINLMAAEELKAAGHEVISALNADEAIEILESRADVRLVFTDIDMPGSMDGLKLAAAVRHRWPPIRIIVTSGMRLPSELPDGAVFIPKPYEMRKLTDTVARLV